MSLIFKIYLDTIILLLYLIIVIMLTLHCALNKIIIFEEYKYKFKMSKLYWKWIVQPFYCMSVLSA